MTITIDRQGSARWLAITNPETRNALALNDRRELAAALYEADRDPETAVVVLTGAGGTFCSGADIREFDVERSTLDASRYASDVAQLVFNVLREMHTPTIARVRGSAAGAGMYLALACDIVVADNDAHFVPSHLALGVVPDWGAIWMLPRLVGLARAKQHLLTGRAIVATDAAQWGLIAEAVAPSALDDAVAGYCNDISQHNMSSVAMTRRGLDKSFDFTLAAFLEWEAAAIASAIQTPEHRSRVLKFLSNTRKRVSDGGS